MMMNELWIRQAAGLACAVALCADCSSAAPGLQNDTCTLVSEPKPLTGLPEASGAALSRRTAGILWSHNDSGQPLLFALDVNGATRGRVRVQNAAVEDWEDVSAARCAAGTCLYIADIGDNDESRPQIAVYRIPEPQPDETQSGPADIFTATYPDGAHDAEALFVVDEVVYLLTKGPSTALYRFPTPLRAGATMRLERVAELPLKRVTDAETSSDGVWVAVRNGEEVAFYRAVDIARGGAAAISVPLGRLKEPQGEGVALDASGTLFLTSEGERAGSVRTLRCTLPTSG
jgi:hypothetical protein